MSAFSLAGVAALFAGVLGVAAPSASAAPGAAQTTRPAVATASPALQSYPDVQSAEQAAVEQAQDPVSSHQTFTSGQITLEAFYCSTDKPTQTYTVPTGVTSVYLEAVGGQGQTPDPNQTGLGGLGGQVSGGLTVSPGQAFTVQVGCAGAPGGGASAFAPGGARGVGWQNLNDYYTIYSYGYSAGGGGGATAVLRGSTPVAVAGGGGGAAGDAPDCYNARLGHAFFFYCGGGAAEQGGNGGDGGGADTQGTVGVNNPAGPTADGDSCQGGTAGLKGQDFDQSGGGGAGGGGGGGYSGSQGSGGGCGGVAGPGMDITTPDHYIVRGDAGNGGGGGASYASDALGQASTTRSDDSGDGYVIFLTSADGVRTTSFNFTGHPEVFCVPDGVNELFVDALGGAGGGGGDQFKGVAPGGPASHVQAVVPVKERTQLQVKVGGYGWAHGGYGDGHGGDRGTASSAAADDGAGGGGSTAVSQSTTGCDRSPLTGLSYLVVAGGGGGGGGDGFGVDAGGGGGGAGDNPGEIGGTGGPPMGGYGGCGGVAPGQGGCNGGIDGGHGTGSTTGGGGGGGGGGYDGGGKGHGTQDGEDGGGGGGGGGASYVTPASPQAAHYSNGPSGAWNNADGRDDGKVDLIVPVPATRSQIHIVSGNKQSGNPGQPFAQPIVLRYTDALSSGNVAGIPITVSVAFGADSPATLKGDNGSVGERITMPTNSAGEVSFTATSAESRTPGQFVATASVTDDPAHLIKSSAVTLFNTQFLTSVKVTSSDAQASDGEPVTFTAEVSSPHGMQQIVQTGSVQFMVDGKPLGAPVAVHNGEAVSAPSTTLVPGINHVAAEYTDVEKGVNGPAFANLAQVVTDQSVTSVSIASSNPAAVSGDAVKFTATIAATRDLGPITGTVQFTLSGTNIGDPVTVGSDGVAVSGPVRVNVPPGTIGGKQPMPVAAVYSGDAHHDPSTGQFTQYVRWSTDVGIGSSAPYGDYSGAALTFTGTISGDWSGEHPAHTGTMQVFMGSEPLTPAYEVTGTTVTSPEIPASKLGIGIHEITIHYSGDANYGPAVSATYFQIVLDLSGPSPAQPPQHGAGGIPGGVGGSSPGHGYGSGLPVTGSNLTSLVPISGLLLAAGALLAGAAAWRVRRARRCSK